MASKQKLTKLRLASSQSLEKRLVEAFALDETLPCLVPAAQRRAMRQSERRAARMSHSEKAAQVALFQPVM